MSISRDENWSSLLGLTPSPIQNFKPGEDERPKTKTTYRMKNGDLIYGKYDYVEDLEYFDDADDSCELVKETWVLVSSEHLTYPEREIEDDDYEDDIIQASDLQRYLGEQY